MFSRVVFTTSLDRETPFFLEYCRHKARTERRIEVKEGARGEGRRASQQRSLSMRKELGS